LMPVKGKTDAFAACHLTNELNLKSFN